MLDSIKHARSVDWRFRPEIRFVNPLIAAIAAGLLSACASVGSLEEARLRDCVDCPDLVQIPAGSFLMGRDGGEPERYDGPVRKIEIARSFLLGRTEITLAQFRAFVEETGYQPAKSCNAFYQGTWGMRDWANWLNPGIGRAPRDDEPVTCVSWNDAKAYVDWIAARTRKPYRLPTEAEFEYAARAGSTGEFPWPKAQDGCGEANMFDRTGHEGSVEFPWEFVACTDGLATVAPVASLKPNPLGLYDIVGNVWEWTQDCYVLPYPETGPRDGSAVEVAGECSMRTVRGASWETRTSRFAVAFRGRDKPVEAFRTFGFRVARDR